MCADTDGACHADPLPLTEGDIIDECVSSLKCAFEDFSAVSDEINVAESVLQIAEVRREVPARQRHIRHGVFQVYLEYIFPSVALLGVAVDDARIYKNGAAISLAAIGAHGVAFQIAHGST